VNLCLTTLPTPLELAPRWASSLGLDPAQLWIKRDDLTGLGGGGNKTRKLAISVQGAISADATVLVTTGAPQSNHARLTAAAGARVGIAVTLVLEGNAPAVDRGNLLLDRLFGAEIIWSGDRDLSAVQNEAVQSLQDQGARPYVIPFGGSSAETAVAYREAAREILTQIASVDHVVVAVGSGGTMAGLVAELGPGRVLGVDSGAVPDAATRVTQMVRAMGQPDPGAALRLDGSQVGRGYGTLTDEALNAMTSLARTEGLVLDPTYTGRAGAGLIKAVAQGRIAPTDTTVFLHTGGLPGLFGHNEL
jgi:D-cysteine desulfhydrase